MKTEVPEEKPKKKKKKKSKSSKKDAQDSSKDAEPVVDLSTAILGTSAGRNTMQVCSVQIQILCEGIIKWLDFLALFML